MAYLLAIAHALGALSAVHALLATRTPQGSVAWIVSLITFPLLAVPAYWVFGRSRFQGYSTLRQQVEHPRGERVSRVVELMEPYIQSFEHGRGAVAGGRLADLPYLKGNAVELLIDGHATFDSILAGIARARDYVLVQFYIVHDDAIGRRLKECLIERRSAGVRVWFLYDEIGSHDLPRSYTRELETAGVHVRSFHTTRGSGNRFQLNFRNHRKIVVVDARVGWLGGHNVGDEYLGERPGSRGWRDTHMRIEGPAVLGLQVSFAEDWRWASDEEIELPWVPHVAPDGTATILILPSGPADRLETASLMYQQAIHSARERIWIASPYFVPDHAVMSALHLAALRGVDVKVLLPDVPDKKLVYYSAFAFIGELMASGVEIHRYQRGFMHQKVFLVDDTLAGVGTANFDNRSFRLNFEITALVIDTAFVAAVERMFRDDMALCRQMTLQEVRDRPWWFRAFTRAAYLTAPIQ